MSYLYEKYDYSLFESRFRDCNRINQFPRGLQALFLYLDEYARETNNPLEVDVIGLCCEFSEIDKSQIYQETGCTDLDDLRDNTVALEIDNDTIIYQAF